MFEIGTLDEFHNVGDPGGIFFVDEVENIDNVWMINLIGDLSLMEKT